ADTLPNLVPGGGLAIIAHEARGPVRSLPLTTRISGSTQLPSPAIALTFPQGFLGDIKAPQQRGNPSYTNKN
ncbi:MAG: hypothetical protein ACWGQW_25525, partial [bacterium]